MKYFFSFLSLILLTMASCTSNNAQVSNTNLSAQAFADKIKELPNAPIIDVRTPEEFLKGHVEHAQNINWNGSDFEAEISKINHDEPVLVYCLSGGRSASAANFMRNKGFKQVFEMQGGMMQWRAANLPETTSTSAKTKGMSKNQFNEITASNTIVLVDFYADWCVPCKKMKPYLDEISQTMSPKVKVVRINVDDNLELCKELKIDALPVLHLYKNNTLAWSNIGYIDKEPVVKKIEE